MTSQKGRRKKNKGRRPSKFVPDRTRKIIEAVRAGTPFLAAALHGGVSYDTPVARPKRPEATKRT